MFTRHVSRQIAAHLDGQLAQRKAQQAELHLRQCPSCRAEYEQVRLGMGILEHLPPVQAPEAIWASIEAALENRLRSRPAVFQRPSAKRWRWAFSATIVLPLAGAAYWRLAHPPGPRWEVLRLEGSPSVGAKIIDSVGRIGAGEWIETDARSRATVKIGEIGSVEVAPNTRVRVVTTRPSEHRLALARGELRAKILAPPRLFFVETASGTAVDLGCEYDLSTGEDGFGLLRVTKGWVSFQWKGLESLVPAGASCRTRPQAGPGIPYFDDAPDKLKHALETFGFEKSGNDALSTILSESRVRDTLTLWHLLSRVEAGERGRIFDRIAALTPIPAGVSREQALKLDPQTLRRWKEELAWTW
jgi:predicted anti-sigma-YlaC factor YlaD